MRMSKDILMEVKDLHISFEMAEGIVNAVHGVNYTIYRGDVLGVVGESGSGKSVTTQAMLGIVPPPGKVNSGTIHFYPRNGSAIELTGLPIDGKAINTIRGGEISLIFQEPMSAFSHLHTIGWQMIECLTLHRRLTKQEAREQSIEMLRNVGIANPEKRIDQYSFELSGGMRQRAMIAMALLTNPSLVIADEPTTSLDVTIQAQILHLLKELQQEREMSIIFITHNLGVVAQISNKIAVMYLGCIVEFGTTDEVFHNPLHPYTVNLLKAIPKIGRGNQRLSAIEGQIPSPFERPKGCPFHTRCRDIIPGICDVHMPDNNEITEGHSTCCWKYSSQKQGADS